MSKTQTKNIHSQSKKGDPQAHLSLPNDGLVPSQDKPFSYEISDITQNSLGSTETRVAAANAAIALLTNTIARLPLTVMREHAEGWHEPLPNHPVSVLLNYPSRRMDSFQFWALFNDSLHRNGNTYAVIRRMRNGTVSEIIPAVGRASGQTKDGRLYYDLRLLPSDGWMLDDSVLVKVPASEVIAVHGAQFNGKSAPSPLMAVAKDILDTMQALNEKNKQFHMGGLSARTVIETSKDLINEDSNKRTELREELIRTITDARNADKIAILPPGYEVKTSQAFSAVDLEIIALLKYNVEEIARIWNVPPRMIQHYGEGMRLTGAAFEQQAEDFVRWSISPHTTKIEKQLTTKLLGYNGKEKLIVKFDTDQIRGGSFSDKVKMLQDALAGGIITANEARSRLGYETIDNEDYDKLYPPRGTSAKTPQDGGKQSNADKTSVE